ncbi:MAG TPA: tetratricopeptide repeat protein [Steroidobacteraceae bacterium]
MSILSELRRRNVFRVAAVYAIAGWVLLQVAELLFGALGVPGWSLRLVLGLLLLGLPLALIFSWVYELTPEGLKREHEVERNESITRQTARKINLLIAVLLAVAIGLGLFGWFNGRGERARAVAPSVSAPSTTPVSGAALAASIAVLPFVNMSADQANEYFSDGLSEELLNVLAKVPDLKVIARTSSFAYKGKEVKISDIARELQVANVLEGSVRKSGDRVRITAQLIRASDSTHLWSETYDRTINDIFALQDEIAGQVVDALKLELLGDAKPSVDVGGTQNPAAYEAYLRGKFEFNKGFTETNARAALAAYDLAVELDPSFAVAQAARARMTLALAMNGYMPFDEGFAQARVVALRAIDLAPNLSDGHIALAGVQASAELDWPGAEGSLRTALRLNPSDPDGYRALADLTTSLGRHEEAIAAARKAVSLDPLSADRLGRLGYVLFAARRYDEARVSIRQAAALAPGRPGQHYVVGLVSLAEGDPASAVEACAQEVIEWERQTCLAIAYDKLGRRADSDAHYAQLKRESGDSSAYQYAEIHAQRGEIDEALKWLTVARKVRDPGLSNSKVDLFLDPLRKDARFEALMRELGLSEA